TLSDGDYGDVTVSGTGTVITIDPGVVTLAKMADLAQHQFIGRTTASTGVPQTTTITAAARTVLDDTTVANMVDTLFGAASTGTGGAVRTTSPTIITPTIAKLANLTTNGFVKTSGGDGTLSVDTNTYLTANQTITLSGDVTGSGTTAITTTIANDAVTYAKMQNVSATSRILGRKTAAAGDPEECTLSEILDFIGSAAQGDILYRGASAWARLGAGTNGRFLQTAGASANPAWADAVTSVAVSGTNGLTVSSGSP